MELKKSLDGVLNIRSLLKQGMPLSEFRLGRTAFHLSAEPDDADDKNLPVRRDDIWQDMLRMVLGCVPEGAEHAPPCHCELYPVVEKYEFSGLAGLPPAVRLMDGFFPVRDQSKRGACFAFALVALCEYMLGKTVELSEQSLFHFTKLVTPGKVEDLGDGAIILDSIHAVEEYGICPLSEWHYNPESWNYVEDPYNEGQGKALQRKLEAAQPYRFRNWRTLSHGSVLQFKQALSAGFPIYTGVLVTTDWDNDDVHKTGIIPFPKLIWRLRILPPPRGLVAEIMAENGIDPEAEEAGAIAMQIAGKLINDTIEYIGSAVFGCALSICDAKEEADFVELVVILDKIRGGHALCLAGYVDDDSYPGGGYFIARNSWSDDKWAPDSPEMPGYALLPYAYIADLGHEGIVMSEFPNRGRADGAFATTGGGIPHSAVSGTTRPSTVFSGSVTQASSAGGLSGRVLSGASGVDAASSLPAGHIAPSAPSTASANSGFDAWLAEHSLVLNRPLRDQAGVLLRPGTPVLVPDPSNPSEILCDTPQNRAKMRSIFDDMAKADLLTAIRDVADEAFGRQSWILSLEDIRESLIGRGFGSASPKDIRAGLLALQEKDAETYALCINQFGREEFRHASVIGGRKRVNR